MPLSKSTLKGLLITELDGQLDIVDAAQLAKVCEAIANAVVDHIQAAALVTSTGVVTSGAGAGGAVTATGTVS